MFRQIELDKRAMDIYLKSGCSLDAAYAQARAELENNFPNGFEKLFGEMFGGKR